MKKNEITHIILDDHHKFQQIEAIESKEMWIFGNILFIEGITAYDNERHHFEFIQSLSLLKMVA